MKKADIVIIGGGPAGLAAAVEAKRAGITNLVVLERDRMPGGILNQCIHNGFGLHTFKEELTGPEYAARFIDMAKEEKIDIRPDTMVMSVARAGDLKPEADASCECGSAYEAPGRGGQAAKGEPGCSEDDKIVTYLNPEEGLAAIRAKAVILAMGCRERPRGALNIPGFRPAGIYTAGTAQRLVNMEGFMPGRKVVILGSGDIGLIMARRMTLEGAQVQVVAELMPYSGGLKRNIVQCLDDYGIPLKLSHTVVNIEGKKRVSAVTIAEVDEKLRLIPGTEERYECDTLLLSCGLIPENELTNGAGARMSPVTKGPVVNESLETSISGVFACGNVLHVHDLVDFVSQEAAQAGKNAAAYVKALPDTETGSIKDTDRDSGAGIADGGQAGAEGSRKSGTDDVTVTVEGGVRYTVPQVVNAERLGESLTLRFRVGAVYRDVYISVYANGTRLTHKKKKICAPGEMETVVLKKSAITDCGPLRELTVKLEQD